MQANSLSIDPEEFERNLTEGGQGAEAGGLEARASPGANKEAGELTAAAPKATTISDSAMECLMRSYRYTGLEPNDLRVGDVPELLGDYKALVEVLKAIVEERGQQNL